MLSKENWHSPAMHGSDRQVNRRVFESPCGAGASQGRPYSRLYMGMPHFNSKLLHQEGIVEVFTF